MSRTGSAAMLRSALSGFASSSARPADALADALADTLALWPRADLDRLLADWEVWARDDQLPPSDADRSVPWRTWLFLGGRGAGKTRAGAEWVRAASGVTENGPAVRIALVGETIADVRSVMVEGQSGLVGIHPDSERPRYEASKDRVVWPNGSVAEFFSAERPDGLRGPQFHAAWCDELVKWRHAEETWDMLQFGLRLGETPRAVVTTTPRPGGLLKRLIAEPSTVMTKAGTFANRANLAPAFIAEVERRYGGTLLGRQELDGEIVEEVTGALWKRQWIEAHRIGAVPELGRTVVAIDPPVTADARSDACGIVVAACGRDHRAYVLADRTVQGRGPDVWARAAIAAFHDFEADCLVAEVNQGGDMVEQVLRQVEPGLPLRKVRATRGKWVRAEPVAALYAEGRVSHVGDHGLLETEMLSFGADGLNRGRSPDRLDALVWALTDLMLTGRSSPMIRRV